MIYAVGVIELKSIAKGVEACDAALKIPMTDGSESLNASAAAAIIMWEYHKQFE